MLEIVRRDPFFSRSMQDLVRFLNEGTGVTALTEDLDEGPLAVDVSEADGEIIVRASMPGFRKEDVDVQIHDGVLSIKATHTESHETKDEKYYRRERRTGSMSRRLALPGVVDDTGAKAELTDGVLTLRIPQAQQARPKQITVQ